MHILPLSLLFPFCIEWGYLGGKISHLAIKNKSYKIRKLGGTWVLDDFLKQLCQEWTRYLLTSCC